MPALQFLQDLVAGQIQLGVFGENVAAGYMKSGALRALGVTTAKRTSLSPDVPTIAEQGVPGYGIEGWFAAIGPRNLPAKEVERLNAAFAAALGDPKVRDAMIARGNNLTPTTPAQARKVIAESIAVYADLVKQAGVKIE